MYTSFYAGILGLLFLKISFETISARRSLGISLGAGEKNEIAYLVSAHSNFSSYTPFFVLLLFFAETIGAYPTILIHLVGVCFFTGRVIHFLTMRDGEKTFKKRKLGMILTLTPIIVLSLLNIFMPIKNYFLNG